MRWAKWAAMALVVVLGIGLFGLIAQAGIPRVAMAALPAAPALQAPSGAPSSSMLVDGQKQGRIKGPSRDGSIPLTAYTHDIVSPRDPQSGLPTGQRMHKPLVVAKPVDRSSPLLALVLVTNENLPKVEIRLSNAAGVYYTIKLTNANIASLHQQTNDDGTQVEQIAFTYQKIEWTWTDGGITASDDWETRTQ